ncbi:putative integral membrane protein [Paenarthrobacter aurescens TC1]|uniref:Integral membrane protein n=2 Tax=Paenarthrobacter aurescens TaxID=43663 RepID=A1R9J2_PAEAT|nr:putative integral membrane protein [Paenarthrobacter aurescens TC1]
MPKFARWMKFRLYASRPLEHKGSYLAFRLACEPLPFGRRSIGGGFRQKVRRYVGSIAQARRFSATRGWAVGCAAASLLAFLGGMVLFFSNTFHLPWTGSAHLVLTGFVGPLTASLAAVVLLRLNGRLPAGVARFTAVGAVPAWALAVTAAASWSVGFDEADMNQGFSWFGSSTLLFMILGWIAGTACLAVPLDALLASRRSLPIRVTLAVLLAAPMALALGALMLMPPMMGTLGAVVLLIVALRQGRSAAAVAAAPTHVIRRQVVAPSPRAVGGVALALLVVGLACAVFAVTGSTWAPMVTDSTHAMNLGLAYGAFASIPLLIPAGRVLAPRLGSTTPWAVLLGCASMAVQGFAQFLGAGHASQWNAILVAATLMGFAIALPLGRQVVAGRFGRIAVVALMGLAASVVGLQLVAMSAFLAPVGSAVLLIWSRKAGSVRQPRLNS